MFLWQGKSAMLWRFYLLFLEIDVRNEIGKVRIREAPRAERAERRRLGIGNPSPDGVLLTREQLPSLECVVAVLVQVAVALIGNGIRSFDGAQFDDLSGLAEHTEMLAFLGVFHGTLLWKSASGRCSLCLCYTSSEHASNCTLYVSIVLSAIIHVLQSIPFHYAHQTITP